MVLALGFLALLTVASAYLPALSGPWLLDDAPNLLQNRAIQEFELTQFDDLRRVAVSGRAGPLGRPVAMLSFVFQRDSQGVLDPGRVKSVNLFLHLLIAGLLGYLAFRIFVLWGVAAQHAKVAALVTAALWCSAPLHVSTVMYAVQRMSQLSTLWVLGGLVIYLRYRTRWLQSAPHVQEALALLLWLGLFFVLGIYSKENAVLLLPLLLLVETCVFAWTFAGSKIRLLERFSWGLLVLYLLLPILLYVFEPAWLTASYADRDFGLHDRVAVQPQLLWKYLQWSLVPNIRPLVFFQDGQWALAGGGSQLFALALLAWPLAILTAVILRCQALIFALCFFLIAHSLESTVFALEVAYEHRNYLPSVGLFIGVLAALFELSSRYRRERFLMVLLGLLFLLSLSMLVLRAQIWTSAESIYRYAHQNSPKSARADFLYAASLLDDSAIAEFGADGRTLRQARRVEALRRLRLLALKEEPDIAALVMLIRIEGSILPELFGSEAWESLLLQSLTSRPLQAEDYTAMVFLTDCLVDGTCRMSSDSRAAFVSILETLNQRPIFVGGLRARLVSNDQQEALGVYQHLAERSPLEPVPHARLIEIYSENGQRGRALQSMQRLMRADTQRRFLAPMARALD
ncbi:conserved hypothetical protein [gamma proteobacterium NOR5-3]|nr:conserved hypothetical protein [gamma proteobacterium NOR5-3]